MVKEWGMVDDSLLFGSRMDFLFKEKSGLKLRTDGYQWMKQTKVKASDKIIKVDPSTPSASPVSSSLERWTKSGLLPVQTTP